MKVYSITVGFSPVRAELFEWLVNFPTIATTLQRGKLGFDDFFYFKLFTSTSVWMIARGQG